MNKIKSILIANRAEISCRVISTAKKMGIKTYSLYTESEIDLPHVTNADHAICLGEGNLAETYLNVDKIISILKEHKIDALHPGYGFLSENADFAIRLKKENIIFIGPSAEAITLMGSKTESKKRLENISTPLIPGYHGDNQDPDFLLSEAKKIGYPVLIKASAGGGGKGMRRVDTESEFMESLESAKREALNAFSDDKVLIEKFVLSPRHIEVQVFSDSHDNHVHLFERDCSVQRRHQKIIEETPSPVLSDELRASICSDAVGIAKEISYLGAGTVEFILDSDGSYYFLEMNTRLQVEHPVTEMITGEDLVRWQILVASGEKLPKKQSEINSSGHSFEVRIYAEDPDNNFFPSIGKILKLECSSEEDLRFDTGYIEENIVSTNFDPMLAKLIVKAKDRNESLRKMKNALDTIKFVGLKNNIEYLSRIFSHEQFKNSDFDTNFVEKHKDELKKDEMNDEAMAKIIACFELSKLPVEKNKFLTWNKIKDFRNV